jgi:PleD family two-component response regulator
LERARSHDEVIQKTTEQAPAAVILNMNDDRMDAFGTLEQIRKDQRSQTVPVLAFANHEEVDTWRRARELGVTKIVSRNEFSARTRDLVDEVSAQGGSGHE